MKSFLVLALLAVVLAGLIGSAHAGGPSMKMQKDWGYNSEEFGCWYQASVLVERPNGDHVCVYPHTAVKTGWSVVINSNNSKFIETDVDGHDIFVHLDKHVFGNTVTYDENHNSLRVDLSTGYRGTLSISIPDIMQEMQNQNCIKPMSVDDVYEVLVNDEETYFEQQVFHDTTYYLEIPFPDKGGHIEIVSNCLT